MEEQMKGKWLIAILFVVLMMCPAALAGEEMVIEDNILVSYTGTEASCEIPQGVKEIGRYAFYGNTSLREIKLPESVQSIEDCAFANCLSLQSVHLPEGLEHIERSAFYHCPALEVVELPQSLHKLGEEAFAFCTSLKRIAFPQSLSVVEKRAFSGCSVLETADFSAGLTAIEEEAFAYCAGLKTVAIPEGTVRIASRAFWACSQLEVLTLPVSVQTLERDCLPENGKLRVIADGNVYAESWCAERGIALSHRGTVEPYWLFIENAYGVPEISNKAGTVLHIGYNAVDLDDSTAWQCNKTGGYIDMVLQVPGAVNEVLIKTGHHKSKTNYQNYSRPVQVELSFCYEGSNAFVDPVICDIEDKFSTDFFSMEFDWRFNVEKVRMTVLKIKKGKELPYNIAVSELRVVGVDMAELPHDFLDQGEPATFE